MTDAFVIEDYVEPVKANPYTPLITSLKDAGEGKLARVRVPKDQKVSTHKAKIAKAAREQGFTAHIKIDEHDPKTGESVVGFILGPLRTRKTKEQIAAESGKVETEASDDAAEG